MCSHEGPCASLLANELMAQLKEDNHTPPHHISFQSGYSSHSQCRPSGLDRGPLSLGGERLLEHARKIMSVTSCGGGGGGKMLLRCSRNWKVAEIWIHSIYRVFPYGPLLESPRGGRFPAGLAAWQMEPAIDLRRSTAAIIRKIPSSYIMSFCLLRGTCVKSVAPCG